MTLTTLDKRRIMGDYEPNKLSGMSSVTRMNALFTAMLREEIFPRRRRVYRARRYRRRRPRATRTEPRVGILRTDSETPMTMTWQRFIQIHRQRQREAETIILRPPTTEETSP